MQILDLPVQTREKIGSANARRYRRDGFIPCNLYGRGQENLHLVAGVKDLENVLHSHSALVRLKLGEQAQTALLRAVDWDVLGERVEHVDLVRVEMEDEVRIKVPVHCVGVPAGTSEGGQLQVNKPDLEILCRVDAIPTDIKVDVSGLHIHDAIHVGELEFPPNVRPAPDAKELVVHLMPPRKADEEVPVVEGEAAEPVEGEKAPEDEKPADEKSSE